MQVEYDFPRESGKVFNAETMQLEEARYSLVTENDTQEIHGMHDRIDTWMTQENLDKANASMGGVEDANARRSAVFNAFAQVDNTLHPINYVPKEFLKYIWGEATDNRAYANMGYFIEHAVNHHPNIPAEKYHIIMDVISHPESIKETFVDDHTQKYRTVVFIKNNDDRCNAVVLRVEKTKTGELSIMYKSFFDQKKRKGVYKNMPDLWNNVDGENKNVLEVTIKTPNGPVTFKTLEKGKSLMGGGTIIGQSAVADPARNRLSAPNDLSVGKDNMNSSPDQGNSKNRAKNSDEGAKTTENGEDIRFSVGEESQKIFDTAKRKFGETKDIREAGYVLPDGVMLDFSGRHELDPGSDSSFLAGRRTTDHRAINQISFVYDENGDEVDTGVSSDMQVHVDTELGGVFLERAS